MVNLEKSAWISKLSSSPLGVIWIAVSENGLAAIEIHPEKDRIIKQLDKMGFKRIIEDAERVSPICKQILDYLTGKRRTFDLDIDWSSMGHFQQNALKATLAIPFGKTATYQDIAQQINAPRAARAVGRAEATNPIPLVIPCHRVIGADGKLHGYGGGKGIETKAWLLQLEKGG
ncbi:MAG: methylated-DNA--[protein]-cysteine S-methyltransferase [Chloroflexi bacterium]|nr:methylated-DNA--[protein]-cysteine S-methyltransferase [Chloroflexota bacterium]